MHGLGVRVGDDLPQHLARLRLGVPGDQEAVEPEAGCGPPGGRRRGADVGELFGDPGEVLAVAEVPVGDASGHGTGRGGVAALEDLRVRALRGVQRFGLEREVADAVEVAGQPGAVLGPDATQRGDELLGPPVAFVVLQPGLAERGELALEPAADDVDREPAAGELVRRGAQLGQHAGVPEAGVDGGDDLQAFGGEQQGEAEGGGLVLVLGAVTGHVADLGQGVVEAVPLGEDGEFAVVVVAPVGALFDGAGDQAAADVGHPVGEAERLGGGWYGHGGTPGRSGRACGAARGHGCAVGPGEQKGGFGNAQYGSDPRSFPLPHRLRNPENRVAGHTADHSERHQKQKCSAKMRGIRNTDHLLDQPARPAAAGKPARRRVATGRSADTGRWRRVRGPHDAVE